MTVLKEASKMVMQILEYQCPVPEKKARFGTWCVGVNTSYGDALLFNVLTKELILLDKSESEFLCINDFSLSDIGIILNSDLFGFLIEHWFLVPEGHDDRKLVEEVREIFALMNVSDGIVGYTILTTTDCNARCFYCYEYGLEKVGMTWQIALDTAEYIKRNASKKVQLHWFGGEPLYNISVIDIITQELKKSGVDFVSRMTSNGFLFTDDVMERAVSSWNLKRIQITLDGTENIYNQRKAYIDSTGSAFQRVLSNIEKLLNAGVHVTVRLNLDLTNAKDLNKLIDLLYARFSSYENFGVYAGYIFDGKTGNSFSGSFDDTYRELGKLQDNLIEKGLSFHGCVRNSIKTHHCMADNDSSIVISPTGELYKCEHIDQSKSCGTIYTGVQDQEIIEYWKKRPEDGKICDTCPLYPDCVRVAACPGEFGYCPQVVYDEKIKNLKRAMLYTYETVCRKNVAENATGGEEPCQTELTNQPC